VDAVRGGVRRFGKLVDGRGTRAPRRRRIAVEVIRELCRLKREVYPNFSESRWRAGRLVTFLLIGDPVKFRPL